MSAQLNLLSGKAEREQVDPARFHTKQDALRWLLSDGEWHGWRELQRFGSARFGARLFEMKAGGYKVERRHTRNGAEYRHPRGRP